MTDPTTPYPSGGPDPGPGPGNTSASRALEPVRGEGGASSPAGPPASAPGDRKGAPGPASPRPAPRILSQRRARVALLVAMGVDLLQIALLPFFAAGVLSPANDVLDVVAAVFMIATLGWHWAFLPTFLAELVPFVGLVPTWTLAVWIATRGREG